MPTTSNIQITLKFNQILELVKTLPKKEKQQLADLLLNDEQAFDVPEAQKQFVRNSIKKHKAQPELLISEKDAWKIING